MRSLFTTLVTTAMLATTAQASEGNHNSDKSSTETVRVWTVDHAGKPPFKRSAEELPVTDAAALELDTENKDTPKLNGRPPFHRAR